MEGKSPAMPGAVFLKYVKIAGEGSDSQGKVEHAEHVESKRAQCTHCRATSFMLTGMNTGCSWPWVGMSFIPAVSADGKTEQECLKSDGMYARVRCMETPQLLLALCMGIALSAACGFRVFVPLLIAGLAVRFAGVHVADSLAWAGSDAALVCLGIATLLEITAYYVPYVDNLLDMVCTPLALIAGMVVMSGMLGDLPAYLQWGIGIVGGAGSAGVVQAGSVLLRGLSTGGTGGIANPVLSTVENILATLGSVLAVFVPILAVGVMILLVWIISRVIRRRRMRRATA